MRVSPQVPQQSGEPSIEKMTLPTVASATAPVTLRLVTPRAIADALGLVGLSWSPQPLDRCDLGVENGLYAWVDGRAEGDPINSGVLYVGKGESQKGVTHRLQNESTWREGAEHGHGLAMVRRRAQAVVDRVLRRAGPDLGWIEQLVTEDLLAERATELVSAWVGQQGSPVARAEEFAIRFAIYAGDVVSPVNCQFATAWNYRKDSGADWGAYAAAAWMRRAALARPGGA